MIRPNQNLPILYLGGDIITFILISSSAFYFYTDREHPEPSWMALMVLMLFWTIVGYWMKLYDDNVNYGINLRIVNYVKVYIILLGLVFFFYWFFPFSLSTKNLVAAIVLGFPVLGIPINFLISSMVSKIKNRADKTKYTLVAGIGHLAGNVEKNLKGYYNSEHQIKGFIKCKKEECAVGQERVVGDLEHINEYLSQHTVDEIVIALPVKVSKKVKNIIAAADYHGVRVKYIPDYRGLLGENYKMTRYGEIDVVKVRQLPLDETSSFVLKNCFDKVFASMALIALSPIFLLLAILIKLDSPGPVFYNPVRIGKGGRPFKVFKFRSMRENDTATGGTMSTQKNDPRITGLGRILRKYSLDELPQFMNVLLGDMSVVGPRPHRSHLNQQLQASVDKYMIRHYFKPGITGWAQVNGWRGPTETEEQRRQRTLHDLWYMENWSLMLDLKIISLTVLSKKAHKAAF